MRNFRLARLAVEAEGLRLRLQAQRSARRVVTGLIALVFLAGALVFVHIAIWYWLRIEHAWMPHWTAAALAGGDLVLALLLTLVAARSRPGPIELEALEVRRNAWQSITNSLALSVLVVPVLRLVAGLLQGGRSRR